MPVTASITKDQRDGLYELVRHHLYSIDDLWIAFGRSRDYATAERLAIEFGEDFRLLTDIGLKSCKMQLIHRYAMLGSIR